MTEISLPAAFAALTSAESACPFTKPPYPPADKRCPKCDAKSSDGCRGASGAMHLFVQAAKDAKVAELFNPRPFCDWHEDHGNVLWWLIPINQPPYVGTKNDSDWPFEIGDHFALWWTPLPDAKRIEDQVPL